MSTQGFVRTGKALEITQYTTVTHAQTLAERGVTRQREQAVR